MLTPQINVALLEGSREPQTREEENYLALIGVRGPRESWPRRDKFCSECGHKFQTIGFPTPTPGGWFFHKVCPKCKSVAERAEEIRFMNREARAREREIQTELPPKRKWSRE
jgi:hypothetical protein